MAPTPGFKGIVYDPTFVVALPIGGTDIIYGDLCKISSGLAVPLSSGDKQLSVYVALEDIKASPSPAILGKFIPLTDVTSLEMVYSGSAPTIGLAYGVTDAHTLSQADTTNKLLEVLSVDSARATADCKAYVLTS